jgi:tyrosine-specific transport protein
MASQSFVSQVIRGSLLISGTAIGAGMLGIPLLTYQAGAFPATFITIAVWLYMLATGLLLLEVTLWMDENANILSMSKRFLGYKGRALAGIVYLFLYYSLMVAYFSAGSPLLSAFLQGVFGIEVSGASANFIFGALFFSIVALGLRIVDRINYILMMGLGASFILLLGVGIKDIKPESFIYADYGKGVLAAPLLLGAFGYHNVIPSLTTYFKKNARVMRFAISGGTTIPLIVYLLWQWMIIGTMSEELVLDAVDKGLPITQALMVLTHKPWTSITGQVFSFFAIVTSTIGVAFAMVDFIGDGFKMKRNGRSRFVLSLLTFFPPFLLSAIDPSLFVIALSLAGGFGETFLNGILPVAMVYKGRYISHLGSEYRLFGKKMLVFLFTVAVLVIVLEFFILF